MGTGSKVRGHEVVLLSLENDVVRFVFIPKVLGDLFFFNNNRNVLVLICEYKHNLRKS